MTPQAHQRALPAQPSLEHLRKEAKQQLAILRSRSASVQLADAQLVVARSYGFSSWRALKAEVDQRRATLGILPPQILGDSIHRPRAATSRALAMGAVNAEQTLFPFLVVPFLAIPVTQAVGVLLTFLIG